ncbi:flagellar motor switch protein FliM [Enterobacteriaceae bacterium RIT714]|nr:flagellar motor switch protein FliM [Enterobacteriaceae bacterium RIT714]
MQTSANRIRVYQKENCPEVTRIDVNKLGRAYHKIPKIITEKFDSIESRLSIFFLKKYRMNATLKNMAFDTDCHLKNAQIFENAYGNIGFDINRTFLLDILHNYYGLSKDNNPLASDIHQPVTKTEERLRNKLAHELSQLTMSQEIMAEELELRNDYSSVINQWAWSIQFWLEGYDEYCFSILLDTHHVDILLATLREKNDTSQPQPRNLSAAQIEHMFNAMPLSLTGKLASINLTVAQLLEMSAGDIIPVSLNEPLPVFIGSEQLFSATVAEDRGKLFMTDFNDKTPEMKYE